MIDRRLFGGVAMHECERRTRDVVVDAVPAADRLRERCLSRAQLSRDRHDERRVRYSSEPLTPVDQLGFAEREMPAARERRDDGLVRHSTTTAARACGDLRLRARVAT